MALKRPSFRPRYRTEVINGHGVFVLSATQQLVLQGYLYEIVTPLLDGRPVEDICAQLHGQTSPAKVLYTIRKLEQRGFLAEHDVNRGSNDAARWSEYGLDPSHAHSRLKEATVSVKSAGIEAADVDAFCSLLESSSIRLADEGDLTVVLAEHYLRPELRVINQQSLEQSHPWMLVKPYGVEIWIGPVMRPFKTGCWECLATRMRCNNPVLSYLENSLQSGVCPGNDFARTPATTTVAWGMAVNAVATWIAGEGAYGEFDGTIRTIDLISYEAKSHELLRQPVCPACAQVNAVFHRDASNGSSNGSTNGSPRSFVLESRKKNYTEDGGHRVMTPDETILKYGRHVSAICGTVSTLERSSGEDDGIMHVYFSGNNIARGPQNLNGLRSDLRSASCGKGATDSQAKASALCEALERYSGAFRGDEPRRKARMRDLGGAAISPADCLLFSEKQYAERDERNERPSVYNHIPMPFDAEQEVDWTPLWSLTHDCVKYLPTSYCYFNYPQNTTLASSMGCSNGNAAGNSLEEAILQGYLELVERDCIGVWWYNRLQMPSVDLDSVDEPYILRLQAYLKKHDHRFWVLDLTSDLGIPTFAAVSQRIDGPSEQIMFGFGSHFDPRTALMRSITELNQMLVVLIRSGKDGVPPEFSDFETSNWLKNATVELHPYLKPKTGAQHRLQDYVYEPTDDLREDVLRCRQRVEEQGMEMLVLDQTREEIGLPVVRVVVPGLRHFWARLAPGRLYDVPVKMGWLDQPTAEDDLNPVPMFL